MELAVTAASPAVKMVVEKLASELWKELGLARSVYTDMGKLQSKLSTIQNVLDDAEKKSITDKALQGWLKKLKDAALDADDVMDEFQTEALRRGIEGYDRMTGKASASGIEERSGRSSRPHFGLRSSTIVAFKELDDHANPPLKPCRDLEPTKPSKNFGVLLFFALSFIMFSN